MTDRNITSSSPHSEDRPNQAEDIEVEILPPLKSKRSESSAAHASSRRQEEVEEIDAESGERLEPNESSGKADFSFEGFWTVWSSENGTQSGRFGGASSESGQGSPPVGEFDPAGLFANLLDNAFPIPGTNYRIGLDPLIGLIPGVGDLISNLLGLYLIKEGRKRQVPFWIMSRMTGNLMINALLGAVPVVGDVFSAFFKSNARNYRLLQKYSALSMAEDPSQAKQLNRESAVVSFGYMAITGLLLATVILIIVFTFWMAWKFINWLF